MANIPEIKATIAARKFVIINSLLPPSLTQSKNSKNVAPAIAGRASRKEYLTAVSRFKPFHNAPSIVEPERVIPGIIAIPERCL
jgi:hypothetical protein